MDKNQSHAVVFGPITFRGTAWSDESNGNLVVAIVRDGAVKTMMFRRDTQPLTPKALNVDEVLDRRENDARRF